MEYSKELTAIQMWLKSTAGLNSFKRGTSVNLSRPVVLFDVPGRGRARHLTRYSYVQTVTWPYIVCGHTGRSCEVPGSACK